MQKQIKVSVIVPIYNVERYLDKCLDSLVNQTLEEIQIILVNDGSPDNSQDIIDKYLRLYPWKIMSLTKENGGLSDARNYGIEYATGEYIGFVDSDDYLDITMYEKLYNRAIEKNAEIVVCGYYGIDEETEKYRYLQKGNMHHFDQNLYENPKLLYINAPYAWNKIFKRDLFIKNQMRFPKGKIYEDIATVYPLMLHANRISKVNEPLYYYILKRKGAITATFSESLLQIYSSLSMLNEYYIEHQAFDEFNDVLGFINLKHTILRFRDFIHYSNRKLQFKIVREGFRHLKKYFRNWKKNPIFFDFYYSKKKIHGFFAKSQMAWYIYSLIPNSIILKFMAIMKLQKKVIKILPGHAGYLNKYRYVRMWKRKPIKENQVLFESFHGTTLSDSPFAMLKELAKNPKYNIYYTSRKELIEEHQKILDSNGLDKVRLVPLGSKKYQDVLATSKYLINNVSFPPYFIKREQQIYLNTWHGTPLKTLGKKMKHGIQDMSNMQRNFLQTTYLLHPNMFTLQHMMEDYNLSNLYTGKVILSGYPRNSIFLDEDAAKRIRKQYLIENKEVFAYMPTWRGAMSTNANNLSYEEEVMNILKHFDQALNANQIMYVNLHPLVKNKISISDYDHIRSFPEEIDNYSFLNAVDILITDYSSVFFDFSITKKPIVLFMYDFKAYMEERGMYTDVRKLPFEKIYTMEDMTKYIKKKEKKCDTNTKEYQEYFDTYISYDTIENTEKINNLIFEDKNTNVKIFDYSHNKDITRTLYLPQKIKHYDDMEEFEKVDKLENPVVVFLRREFTVHTSDMLSKKYGHGLDYTVIDTHMFLSMWDNIKLYFARKNRKFVCDNIYRMELHRILPNIQVKNVVTDGDMYRNCGIKHAVENQSINS